MWGLIIGIMGATPFALCMTPFSILGGSWGGEGVFIMPLAPRQVVYTLESQVLENRSPQHAGNLGMCRAQQPGPLSDGCLVHGHYLAEGRQGTASTRDPWAP